MKRSLVTALLLGFCLLPAQAQRREAPAGPPNPFWRNTQAVNDGEQLYDQHCTACHGVNGGAGEIGPAILSDTEGLRGQLSDAAIVAVTRAGVPGTVMPAWTGKLADDDILKIGAYLRFPARGTALDNPLPGDAAHGAEIFTGKGQCGACHMMHGQGGLKGPDLSNIAAERKTSQIVDALTKPMHRIYGDGGAHLSALPTMDTYDAIHITLIGGKSLDGVLLNQDSYSIQMLGDDNQLHLLDRAQVKAITVKPALMPTDYDKRLTFAQEFDDLMAFLSRQGRKAPATAAARSTNPG